MPRPKSLIANVQWTIAGRLHNCRNNKNHEIKKGDNRLTVREDRTDHHYCMVCAKNFLKSDIEKLQGFLESSSTFE